MLVTYEDLETILRREFTDDELDAVDLIITLMQSEVTEIAGRPLEPTVIVAERVEPNADGYAFLRNTPVTAITAVRYPGNSTPFTTLPTIEPGGVYFGLASGPLEVDYTAGLAATEAAGLRSVIIARLLRILAKVTDDAIGVRTLTQEGYTAAYLEEGFTEQELAIIGKRHRRVVA